MTAASARAQTAVNFNVAGPASWNDLNSWSTLQIPEAQFSEFAVIGGARSAFVNDSPPAIGGVTIGAGTLEIQPTGNLTVVAGGLNTGRIILGSGGASNVSIRRGGTLTGDSLTTAGGAATQLVLGGTTGSGTSTLTVGNATLAATTRVIGPNVNFDVTGNLTLDSTSQLVAEITGTTHSAIDVTGSATLGGTVRVEFNGYAPVLGNSWTLVNAASVTGNPTIDASAAPALARGTGYQVIKTPTSAALTLTNQLVLTVNRLNGLTKIENVVGSPILLDGYTIASPGGNLGGAWNSLQDQLLTGWDEAATSNSHRLTEFKTSSGTSIGAGASLSIGTPFLANPPALGVGVQTDLAFQYTTSSKQIIAGTVELSGPENNLVLTINPANGLTTIQNESPFFNATIDAYTITSTSGKLKVANGDWISLDDQNVGSWDEADNANANRVTEFSPNGATLLGGGGTIYAMGDLVNVVGGAPSASDFTFSYTLSNGTEMTGIVKVGALPTPGLSGDVNFDKVVNIFDINLVSSKWNTAGPSGDANHDGIVNIFDINLISSNWGAMGGSATAVPEPSSILTALIAMGCLATFRRRSPKPQRGPSMET